MCTNNRNITALISNLFTRKRNERRQRKAVAKSRHRTFQMEGLEKREMFAISTISLSGGALQMWTDNNSTSVTVSQNGSNYRVSDNTTSRTWDYATSSVSRIDFIGGAGNDRFVNMIPTMNTRAWGQGGDDYLEGYGGVDEFYGGENNDTLVGYGGSDTLRGGNGNDVIRGDSGIDYLYGDAGNDHIEGGSEGDQMWGGDNDDVLLGGTGDDQIVGDGGNDQLNGQGGFDRMWGTAGNDVLISIDGAFNEYVDGGADSDVLWIDYQNNFVAKGNDSAAGVTSADTVHYVGGFANGADLSLDGDNIADPSDIGNKLKFTNNITADNIRGSNPLFPAASFGTTSTGVFNYIPAGPRDTDVVMGTLGDCWIMAPLSAIANKSPELITRNVVDFNDGTFGVRLGYNYYRVDGELAVTSTAGGTTSDNLRYSKLGAQNSMWVAVVEKAFTSYRSSQPTFQGIVSGQEKELFNAFRMNDANSYFFTAIYGGASYMANDLYNRMLNGYSQTIGIKTNSGKAHGFTITGFTRDAAGAIAGIILRNPWGKDGLENFNAFAGSSVGSSTTDGVITVSINTLFNSGGWVAWGRA